MTPEGATSPARWFLFQDHSALLGEGTLPLDPALDGVCRVRGWVLVTDVSQDFSPTISEGNSLSPAADTSHVSRSGWVNKSVQLRGV